MFLNTLAYLRQPRLLCYDLVRLCSFYLDLCVRNRPRNWKYREKGADKLSKVKEANGTMNIPSIVRRRTFVNSRSLNKNKRSVNLPNLIPVESDASAYNHRERDFNVKSSYVGLFNWRSMCNKAIILKDCYRSIITDSDSPWLQAAQAPTVRWSSYEITGHGEIIIL